MAMKGKKGRQREARKNLKAKQMAVEHFKLKSARRQLTRLSGAVNRVEAIFKDFIKANGPMEILVMAPNSQQAVSPCKEHWVCYGAKARAKNIVVTVVSKGALKRAGCARITDCAIQKRTEAKIHQEVDQDFCVPDCGQFCRCLTFSFRLKLHESETDVTYLDRTGTRNPPQADRACRIKIDITFDIDLTITIGVCLPQWQELRGLDISASQS
jgi:hypothetical protein